jgi:CheY-like chemotaxis protein
VRLPVVAEETLDECRRPVQLPHADLPRRRVLIVDDNVDAAESLAMLLSALGHETHLAHDGPKALSAVDALRPDIVFLDIGLPLLNGYEVARRIRRQDAGDGPQLIALTGWGQPEDRRQAKEAGFDHHVTKPVELDVLLRLMAGRRITAEAWESGLGII